MTELDIKFIERILRAGLLRSPCLEIGSGLKGNNVKKEITGFGISYFGADIIRGSEVDFIVNFEDSSEVANVFRDRRFGSILALNVLEHVFEPIRFLDNAFRLLMPGGTCVIIAPCVWSLHNYPFDFWRINPDFYEQYAARRNIEIVNPFFEYIGYHGIKVSKQLPAPSSRKFRMIWSRAIHKIFNTCGREMFFPSHIVIGVVMKKSSG